jgi:hypothetical protein
MIPIPAQKLSCTCGRAPAQLSHAPRPGPVTHSPYNERPHRDSHADYNQQIPERPAAPPRAPAAVCGHVTCRAAPHGYA